LLFNRHEADLDTKYQRLLSEEGDLEIAASKLYDVLHQLDKLNLDVIIAERFPEYGLGNSINDRLERAAKKENNITNDLTTENGF
jgi:L-threonylcarbamoyladenylate synthase